MYVGCANSQGLYPRSLFYIIARSLCQDQITPSRLVFYPLGFVLNLVQTCLSTFNIAVQVNLIHEMSQDANSNPFFTLALALKAQAQLQKVFTTGDGEPIENLAVRKNGDVLFNSFESNATFVLSKKDGQQRVTQLPSIPVVTGLFGITEVNDDIFVISGGTAEGDFPIPPAGAWVTYAYDFNKDPVAISKVADVPRAAFLNGAATIPPRRRGQNGTALFSDTLNGIIFHIDPTTGQQATIFQAEANSTSPPPAFVRPGVNGLEYSSRFRSLFFANLGPFIGVTTGPDVGSVKLNIRYNPGSLPTITTVGPADIFGPGVFGDDFAVAPDGTVFAALFPENRVVKLERNGKTTELVSNSTNPEFQRPSSVQFGRTREDRDVLYITTLGDINRGVLWSFTLSDDVRA
ncbi:Hypothetical protein D9617_22g066820 [Elsinoe fawcettii]|nr:Hypothetical protein D9617_22g066820 [Elsinoe fawcettii]